jgi:hypothetical protein
MERTASTTQEPTPEAGTASPPASTSARAADSRDRSVGVVCGLLLLVGMPIAYFSGDTKTGEAIACFVFIGLWLIAIALLVTRFVPSWRARTPERATRIALILGVLALITTIVFWTGLPFPLGAGAIMLGLTLRESAPANARGKATVALGLGSLAVLASFVLLLIG